MSVADFLLQGEANAISTKLLVEMTGARSARQLRNIIERERLNGTLILSTVRNGGGYFLPSEGAEGKAEINAFVRTVHARAVNSLAILKSARQALQEIDGQQSLEGV